MIVLIPAYRPDQRLVELVDALRARQAAVVTVDDGSGPAYRPVFDAVERLGGTVVRHPYNRGKGRALKSGLSQIAGAGGAVVCADADGQHDVADILRVGSRVRDTGAMVLGTRRFGASVPLRSRVGNALTRAAFTAATGRRLRDTQTGLRGYPAGMLSWLQSVPGERYDYEMNVLLEAARGQRRLEQTDIATIYLDGNASSHFRPVLDSLRVWARLLRFVLSSLLSFVVDTVALLVLNALTGLLLPSVLGARALSATVNFLLNRGFVFGAARSSPWRYAALAATLLAGNYLLIRGLTTVGVPLLAAKLGTEAVLFVVSYRVQRRFVFRS